MKFQLLHNNMPKFSDLNTQFSQKHLRLLSFSLVLNFHLFQTIVRKLKNWNKIRKNWTSCIFFCFTGLTQICKLWQKNFWACESFQILLNKPKNFFFAKWDHFASFFWIFESNLFEKIQKIFFFQIIQKNWKPWMNLEQLGIHFFPNHWCPIATIQLVWEHKELILCPSFWPTFQKHFFKKKNDEDLVFLKQYFMKTNLKVISLTFLLLFSDNFSMEFNQSSKDAIISFNGKDSG